MHAQVRKVMNFGNAVCYECEGETMLETIRAQLARYREAKIIPAFILMNSTSYHQMVAYAQKVAGSCHNSDQDTVNGIPVVICESTLSPVVTAQPSELAKHGLL